jgi:hypothetical protein
MRTAKGLAMTRCSWVKGDDVARFTDVADVTRKVELVLDDKANLRV